MKQPNIMQKGFTLIELIVVIVILGILAATALPKFVDMSSDAGNAASQGVAAAIASATSMNYSRRMISSGSGVALNVADTCGAIVTNYASLVSGVTLDGSTTNTSSTNTFGVSGTLDCSGAGKAGTTGSCSVIGSKGTAQTATVTCSN